MVAPDDSMMWSVSALYFSSIGGPKNPACAGCDEEAPKRSAIEATRGRRPDTGEDDESDDDDEQTTKQG